MNRGNSSKEDDVAQILKDCKDRVTQFSKLLRSATDLPTAIKCASNIVSELRNGFLTPKLYYELYLDVFDALLSLDDFLTTLTRNGTPAQEIYDTVQRCTGVLQRLYLMAIAGAVLIKSKQASARVVLTDLTEHVKGVQHPQRGLFLRYFLLQKLKDRLPDKDSDFSTSTNAADDKKDCIDFLTSNLIEMNRLWIRMQSPTSGTTGIPVARNRKKRERERLELRILVGSNLTRLSALNCLDLSLYSSTVLPALLSEIVSCKDKIAQAYIAEGLLQVFPLEYHLSTLTELLRMLPMLVSDHKTIKTVVCTLLSRIQEGSLVPVSENSINTTEELPFKSVLNLPHPTVIAGVMPRNVDAFGTILQYVSTLTSDPLGPFRPMMVGATTDGESRQDGDDDSITPSGNGGVTIGGSSPSGSSRLKSSSRLASLREAGDAAAAAQPLASLLEIFIALMSFSKQLYPGHNAYVDAVLAATGNALQDVLGLSSTNPLAVPPLEIFTKNESLRTLLEVSKTGSNSIPVPISLGANGVGLDDNCSQLVVTLLSNVHLASTLDVLELKSYPTLVQPLSFRFRRNVAAHLLATVITLSNDVSSPLRNVQVIERLFSSLFPLIREDGATPADALPQDEEMRRFVTEQNHLTRLLELLSKSGFDALNIARESLSWGGAKRIRLTYPSLLKQVLSIKESVDAKAVYIFAYELCSTVALANYPDVALEMFVDSANEFETGKYKESLLSQARLLYQDLLQTTNSEVVSLKFGGRLAKISATL